MDYTKQAKAVSSILNERICDLQRLSQENPEHAESIRLENMEEIKAAEKAIKSLNRISELEETVSRQKRSIQQANEIVMRLQSENNELLSERDEMKLNEQVLTTNTQIMAAKIEALTKDCKEAQDLLYHAGFQENHQPYDFWERVAKFRLKDF